MKKKKKKDWKDYHNHMFFSAEITHKEHWFEKKYIIPVILHRYQMYDQMTKSALGPYADSNVTVFTPADVAQ